MPPRLRTALAACALLSAGYAGGLSVAAARGDELVAQATPPAAPAQPARTSVIPGVDNAALERLITVAVTTAVERATNTAIDRLQRTVVPPEITGLRQQLGTVGRIGDEIASIRRSLVGYAVWGAVGLFVLLVLASVVGGTIVALLFRSRRA